MESGSSRYEVSQQILNSVCGQRIAVVGTTGSGKTTTARWISQRLGLPHVELDALHWDPDWTPAPPDVFRERTARALSGDIWTTWRCWA